MQASRIFVHAHRVELLAHHSATYEAAMCSGKQNGEMQNEGKTGEVSFVKCVLVL
jgi:hypothetical protein